MPGRVFVTGASGFVGSAIVQELLARDHTVTALVHRRTIDNHAASVQSFQGDLHDPASLAQGMSGCDAIIHVVGIIMERPSRGVSFQRMHVDATRSVVDAARRAGIRRYVHMSALGTRPDAASDYHKTKFAAEQIVRASGLEWTIFRPSLIHGPRGEFMQLEAKWVRKKAPPFLFMPYFGAGAFGRGGAGQLQPIHVNDVARAFVDALQNRRTIGEIYPIAGPDRISWPQLHRISAQAIRGRNRWVMPLPVWKARLLAATLPNRLLGFNRDQVLMSQEDNTADITKFTRDFGWSPAPFDQSLRTYAHTL
jgi:uncharacterized protein YbjT (DUF2867 family)